MSDDEARFRQVGARFIGERLGQAEVVPLRLNVRSSAPPLGRDGVAEAVEPRAGIEVLAARHRRRQRRQVGVAHDDQPQLRFRGEQAGQPIRRCRAAACRQTSRVGRMVAEPRAQVVDEPEPDLGMEAR